MPKTKEQKRVEAEARQHRRLQRNPLEQLEIMDERPGNSDKERARLEKELRYDEAD
jgi:hypothetical protein